MDINNLTQVIVPGSAEIYFPKEGVYAVYYEYHRVYHDFSYVRSIYLPKINCQLTSKDIGQDLPVLPEHSQGNIYTTQNYERAGVLIKSIRIEEPGINITSCQYTDGKTDPKIILAVDPKIVWEFFKKHSNLSQRISAACSFSSRYLSFQY